MLTVSNVNLFIDHLARAYARALGVAGSTSYGIGDAAATDRAQGAAEDLLAAIIATGDVSVMAGANGLLDPATRWTTSLTAVKIARNSEIMSRLQRQVAALEAVVGRVAKHAKSKAAAGVGKAAGVEREQGGEVAGVADHWLKRLSS